MWLMRWAARKTFSQELRCSTSCAKGCACFTWHPPRLGPHFSNAFFPIFRRAKRAPIFLSTVHLWRHGAPNCDCDGTRLAHSLPNIGSYICITLHGADGGDGSKGDDGADGTDWSDGAGLMALREMMGLMGLLGLMGLMRLLG